MTDRELLEKAAKAAGYADATWRDMEGWGEDRYGFSSAMWSETVFNEGGSGYWNPLADDAQALRLAVKLGIGILYSDFMGEAEARFNRGANCLNQYGPDDPCAATRRAIVRAAAALGEDL